MKVRELIQMLDGLDPDASVYLMSQQRQAYEVAIYGIATRNDLRKTSDDQTHNRTCDRCIGSQTDLPANDVFIVEGSTLRNGSHDAWKISHRNQ